MSLTALAAGLILGIILLALVFRFAPRPRLDPSVPPTQVPDIPVPELPDWLADHEAGHSAVIDGAEATIHWADEPQVADLCLLYVHGFSATRQETAPLTGRIAEAMGANVVYTRLAGHGLSDAAMQASAEHWLQSMVDCWEIASRIGRRVVIIATSTGAPLSVWLNQHVVSRDQVHSFIFLSPNFRIRNPFGFLLTWPWAESWVPLLAGREHSWEPENELAGRYWTSRYSTQAVIEMQKVVDWAHRHQLDAGDVPLATLYMEGDPTIDHAAAVAFHENWGSETKTLHQVTVDAENPQHVFAGEITAPHRVDWTVARCLEFLRSVPEE